MCTPPISLYSFKHDFATLLLYEVQLLSLTDPTLTRRECNQSDGERGSGQKERGVV